MSKKTNKDMNEYTVVELFAGAGGLALILHNLEYYTKPVTTKSLNSSVQKE